MNSLRADLSSSVGGVNLKSPVVIASGVWPYDPALWSPERLEGVGRRLGKLLPGGVVDLDGAGRAFLEALSSGKLGRWSLEVPPAPPPGRDGP